ncbi:MAG TPA: ABC transporter ATP-binding protein [Candidatus Paceibacterota bacterium]|nr:ABC transporter ATP-binding protein [Candidatus Paceibacterota bacterium]
MMTPKIESTPPPAPPADRCFQQKVPDPHTESSATDQASVVIETRRLRKVYRQTVAVDSLTLRVHRGEVFGFLGPNGAGKTTTIKMLLGLACPTRGTARLLGETAGSPDVMRRVGFLPEHFRFHPWLTASQFLDLHGRLHGLPKGRRRESIPKLLDRVGLGDQSRVRLSDFSKGMTQRVGLAQALLNDPEVVFLDEPTSALDPMGRREVRDIMRDLRQSGITVFLNSHLLSEVEITCDRVAIVKQGRVIRCGALADLSGGAVQVEIRAGGMTQGLIDSLSVWGRILSAVQADACWKVLLAVPNEEFLPQIADQLVQAGACLYSLSPQRLSLEELFVQLMNTPAHDDIPTA